jgi:hypothetical protein
MRNVARNVVFVAAVFVAATTIGCTGEATDDETGTGHDVASQTVMVKLQRKGSWRVLTGCSGDVQVKTVSPGTYETSWKMGLATYLDNARAKLDQRGILVGKSIDLCINSSLKPGRAGYVKSGNKIQSAAPQSIPRAQLYHEIGHWAMVNLGGFDASSKDWSGCGAVSAWGGTTTQLCAFLEGWADFFATELLGSATVMDVDYSKSPPKKGDTYKGSVATYLYKVRRTETLDFVIQSCKKAVSLKTINPFYCGVDTRQARCKTINSAKLAVGAIPSSQSCACNQDLRRNLYPDCDNDGAHSYFTVWAVSPAHANYLFNCRDGGNPDGGWSTTGGYDMNDEQHD